MRLVKARVTKFRSIDDSGEVKFNDVTCLVGKNESGKTAFLHALHRLSPTDDVKVEFKLEDYPRKDFSDYQKKHDTDPDDAVTATFELTDEEVVEIESSLGNGVMRSREVAAIKNYKNSRRWEIEVDESVVVQHIISNEAITPQVKEQVEDATTLDELLKKLAGFEPSDESAKKLSQSIRSSFPQGIELYIINNFLTKFIPRFVYFDEYSFMPGKISFEYIKQMRAKKPQELDDGDRTFLALMDLAGVKLESIDRSKEQELAIAALEGAQSKITREMFSYWSQNDELKVKFLRDELPNSPNPKTKGTILDIRIENTRHDATVPFDGRSRGFVWFFSFFVYFSQLKHQGIDMILLLDEPGLNLHAKAQSDLLRYINERLATEHQVVYTTHSPFMIDPDHFERARMVEDDKNLGTVISEDIFKTGKDTFYPLQAALGIELSQTLFIGPNNLLVEGESDLKYLKILDLAVRKSGGNGLDPRWVIAPVQGAGKLQAHASILAANRLNIMILMDSSSNDSRLKSLKESKLIGPKNIVGVGEIVGRIDADIEDMFDPEFYLELVNEVYDAELPVKLTLKYLTSGNSRIVRKVENYFENEGINGGHFRHDDPADELFREYEKYLSKIDDATIKRATQLFEKINERLKPYTSDASARKK